MLRYIVYGLLFAVALDFAYVALRLAAAWCEERRSRREFSEYARRHWA